jgi:hypothetical protein
MLTKIMVRPRQAVNPGAARSSGAVVAALELRGALLDELAPRLDLLAHVHGRIVAKLLA